VAQSVITQGKIDQRMPNETASFAWPKPELAIAQYNLGGAQLVQSANAKQTIDNLMVAR